MEHLGPEEPAPRLMQPIWPLAAALAHLQAASLEVPSPMAIPSPHAWRGLESALSGVPCPEGGFLCAEAPPPPPLPFWMSQLPELLLGAAWGIAEL